MRPCDALLAALPRAPEYEYDWAALDGDPALRRLIEAMAGTPQEPDWHGEGNVWTHTQKVCRALTELDEFRAMDAGSREVLSLAALLHDIGKIRCTRTENGRLVSPRHGPVGAQMARSLLWRDMGLCGDLKRQRLREAVCLLIKYHTRPLHFWEDSETTLLRLASNGSLTPRFTLEALCLLAEADRLGSVAADNPEMLERIELGQELCREAGCYEGPYPFASSHTRRRLFAGGAVWKDQILYDDTWGEVILLCGLPGTGKDAWCQSAHPGLPTVSLDDLRRELDVDPGDDQGRVVQATRERAREYLRARQPFIWNATSLTGLRSQQIELFEQYHARARIVFLETDWNENLRRNAERACAVPEAVVSRMLDRLEPPERWEAHEVNWICV